MSFIKRELDRIRHVLCDPSKHNRYDELYAAQQALAWASEPNGYASPMKMITDISGDSEGCSALPRPPSS